MKVFKQFITEGVYDPSIFKVFFLAGGPGSGKSYVAGKTMGGGFGLKMVNSDELFELLMSKAGQSLKFDKEVDPERDAIRDKAKKLTATKLQLYLSGRLGIVIDGTGKDFDKIAKQKKSLEELGYDTYMVFVNTSLEVAKARNLKRARSIPDTMVEKLWSGVQANIGRFQGLFGSGNFIIVDNNNATEDVLNTVSKEVRALVKKPVKNHIAKAWINDQMKKKAGK